jgi:hypothetical protein
MLHLALKGNNLMEAYNTLQHAYKAAANRGQPSRAATAEPATPLSAKPRKRQRVIETPLGRVVYNDLDADSDASDEESRGYVPQAEGGLGEVSDGESKEDVHVECVSKSEMVALLVEKDEQIAMLKSDAAVMANEIAALKLQLQELMQQREEPEPAHGNSPSERPTSAASGKQRVGGAMGTQRPTQQPRPSQTSPPVTPQRKEAPKPTYSSVAASGVKPKPEPQRPNLPAKEIRELRRYVAPFSGPPKVEKLCFVWNGAKGDAADRKAEFAKVRRVLAAAGVKSLVKEVSFIGRSLVQLFVEERNAPKVKDAMRAFARADTYVSQSEIDSFKAGKLHGADLQARVDQRLVVLLARNQQKNMQECILRGVAAERHPGLLAQAASLRAGWDEAAKLKRTPGDNDCQ